MGSVGSVGSLGGLAADVVSGGRLEQFPSFPGRQLSQNLFAFTQAQPLQEPDLLHLQHAIFENLVQNHNIRKWRLTQRTATWQS